ncbi:hypothetical protein FCM35_KLT03674 [Carex littledalei]|uniref:Uncharacterized protein n=1 Tax=Carex littledalei TaxID=544730 RepID=A0A833QN91_9POAL|nr:hypothetical protein FCM35_KLT03674 [Carex littledalei]
MASTGAMDAEEFIQGRTAYIRKISDELSKSTLLPTATEERLFEEALRHVIHVVSSKEYAPAEVRDAPIALIFGSVSLFTTVHHAEELMELNQYWADLSEFLLEVDIGDVSTLNPLMGTKDRYEMAPVICGSNEKSYMFYKHKFMLASKDLRCSEFAFCPPLEDEERSYVQVLDAISSPLIAAEDDMNVYSEELFSLYIKNIHQDIEDIGRHFAKIKGWILKNLSLIDWWETAERDLKEFRHSFFDDDLDPDYAVFQKKLTDKCIVSNGDLPDYICQVDRCLRIALLFHVVISSLQLGSLKFCGINNLNNWRYQAGWEAVHALTLLKQVPLENHQAKRKHEHILHEKRHDENVVILEGIVDDLRHIGNSDIMLDKEEMVLVHKIWGSVASSIQFFVSAMAYEQRRYIIQHYDLFDPSMLGLPAAKTIGTDDLLPVYNKQLDWHLDRDSSLFEHPGIVENVIAYLGLWDVLSLGSCSKYLNGVCESDCTWKLHYKRRWGQSATGKSYEDAQTLPVNTKGWKLAYIARQKDWFATISEVLLAVEENIQNDCMSSDVFHNGINQLKALDITYDDIYSFFFSKKLNVIFTMLGLYYAYILFQIPAKELKKAMAARGVIDKVVCARWMIPATCSLIFYMPEENYMRLYSLGQVVENQMSVLWVMRQSYKNYEAVPRVTLSYKIPEPLNCMAHHEK